jgi:hypothetical protein
MTEKVTPLFDCYVCSRWLRSSKPTAEHEPQWWECSAKINKHPVEGEECPGLRLTRENVVQLVSELVLENRNLKEQLNLYNHLRERGAES